MNLKIVFHILLIFHILSGCSSTLPKISEKPIEYDQSMSYAKNILYASGISPSKLKKMKDAEISASDYQKLKSESSMIDYGTNAAVLSGTAIALDMHATVGTVNVGSIFSSADFRNMVGLGLIRGLLAPQHPSLQNHVAFWMPKKMAKTENEMKELIEDVFIQAHLKSIPEGYKLEEVDSYTRYQLTGGVCDKEFNVGYATCGGSLSKIVFTSEMIGSPNNFQPGFRPEFVDNPGKLAWVGYLSQGISHTGIRCQVESEYNEYQPSQSDIEECNNINKQYHENLKNNLPNWIYEYSLDSEAKIGKVVRMGKKREVYPLIVVKG